MTKLEKYVFAAALAGAATLLLLSLISGQHSRRLSEQESVLTALRQRVAVLEAELRTVSAAEQKGK